MCCSAAGAFTSGRLDAERTHGPRAGHRRSARDGGTPAAGGLRPEPVDQMLGPRGGLHSPCEFKVPS
eukprot:15436166-Alexandrium_andersonii.AAC.1